MDVVVWIVSGVLAALFLFAGASKLATPRERLVQNPQMAWAEDFSEPVVKLIGTAEVLAALGLVLPWAFDIAPVLTPLAASGLVVVMAGAVATHIRRKELFIPQVALLALALFVAIVRFAAL